MAPNAGKNKKTDRWINKLIHQKSAKQKLTVDDDDLHHGNGEKGQWFQRNFDEDSSDNED